MSDTIQGQEAQVQGETQEPKVETQESSESQPEKSESLGWRAALEKDLQDNPLVKDKTKPSDFVREALKWAEIANKNVIEVPKEGATKEEKEAFYKAIGRPETPDGYTLPDEVQLPEDLVSQAKKIAFDAGLTNNQAKDVIGLFDRFIKTVAESEKQNQEQAKQKQLEQLQEEWGDQFKENRTRVGKLALKLFADVPNFLKWAKDTGFYDSVPFNKMLYTIAQKVGDDTLIEGSLKNSTPHDEVGYSFPNTPGME